MTPAISFDHVSKRYRLGQSASSLRSLLRSLRPGDNGPFHWALRDVNFQLEPGEAVGVIGPNGAGKTTILKLLSGVTRASAGSVRVNGRSAALIELGAGFHPELTGRENVYLNGIILGMRRAEIEARFDRIVEFAGIGDYLDMPVKRYSSGMYARLGFAVAAHVEPEVLLVDEVLAVGDMAFRQKCYEHMLGLLRAGTTLVLVSHDFAAIQKVCRRCLVMHDGGVAFDGSPAEATAEYSNILRRRASAQERSSVPEPGSLARMTHGAVIEQVELLRADGQPALAFRPGEMVHVRVTVRFAEAAPSPVFACTVRQPDGQIIYDFTTHWANLPVPDFQADSRAVIEFMLQLNLVDGTYHLGLDLAYADFSSRYDRLIRAVDFVIAGGDGSRGVADLAAQFRVLNQAPITTPPEATATEVELARI